jgi:hypothetical protein
MAFVTRPNLAGEAGPEQAQRLRLPKSVLLKQAAAVANDLWIVLWVQAQRGWRVPERC